MGLLGQEREKPYFRALEAFIDSEPQEYHPPRDRVFQALTDVSPGQVRVVILGQDPYHGAGQAMGRSFAVPNGLRPKPPSLLNILKEVQSDLGFRLSTEKLEHSDLSGWASQGVLLLNTVLTVRTGTPLSHRNRGWETFTDHVLSTLAPLPQPVVFMLWGSEAQKKRSLIQSGHHLILESVHPSPLSAYRGFLGCRHFSKCNEFLSSRGATPIDWTRISEAC